MQETLIEVVKQVCYLFGVFPLCHSYGQKYLSVKTESETTITGTALIICCGIICTSGGL